MADLCCPGCGEPVNIEITAWFVPGPAWVARVCCSEKCARKVYFQSGGT